VSRNRLRAGLAVPALFALAACATFVALGTWQMQRRTWKTALITTMEQRMAAAPLPLPSQASWATLEQSAHEFERVKLFATYVPGTHARVYGIASAARSDPAGPGFWIFMPAAVAGGGTAVVNRGFVPEGKSASMDQPPEGTTELTGVLRWPEARGFFAPADDAARNLFFVRDPIAIAAAKGWGEVAPFYVDLEAPVPPGGLPALAPLQVNLRNDHLQYAITWYGLAAVVLVMFVFWVRSRSPDRA
jgi:cytochrome oxidase assembly protein ShyY1